MRDPPNLRRAPPSDSAEAPRAETAAERAARIRFSLPLLFLAASSLVISFVLYHEAFANHATRVPIWALAFSVGIIASVGGSTSLAFGDYSDDEWEADPAANPELIVLDRTQWDSLREELRQAREARAAPTTSSPDSELPVTPEWSEPTTPELAGEAPMPLPVAPPAPMAVAHRFDSLATEVERLVADLEATAAQLPAPAARPPPPSAVRRATAPARPAAASAAPLRPAPRNAPVRPAEGGPSPLLPPPLVGPDPRRAGASTEYRHLLEELERRAGEALRTGAVGGEAAPKEVRCVGCDAHLPPGSPGTACKSCRSPICASCRLTAKTEGHPELCPVCAILKETEPADGPD